MRAGRRNHAHFSTRKRRYMPIYQTLKLVLGFAAAIYLMRQVRKPTKWAGRPFAWIMNYTHSALTDWGLAQVRIEESMSILDVGCGGGRTIQKLSAMATRGKIDGVDYAAGSVAASRARNADLIRAGRVQITQASVSKLPFPDNQFDLVTAVETQYYWPDLVGDMREILRVLKPGGMVLVILESYEKGRYGSLQGRALKLLGGANLSVEDEKELFTKAGYIGVEVHTEQRKGWLCATGKKAASHDGGAAYTQVD